MDKDIPDGHWQCVWCKQIYVYETPFKGVNICDCSFPNVAKSVNYYIYDGTQEGFQMLKERRKNCHPVDTYIYDPETRQAYIDIGFILNEGDLYTILKPEHVMELEKN